MTHHRRQPPLAMPCFLHLSPHRRHESTESLLSDHPTLDATACISYSYSGIDNDWHEKELLSRKDSRAGSPFFAKPKMLVEVARAVMLMIPLGCYLIIIDQSIPRLIYGHHHPAKTGMLQMYNASYQKIAHT